MKLLDKKTIDTQKQQERKTEIDEGVKLAISIDEMRRLKADESTNFTQWRNNALRSIQGEIDAYLLERDGYKEEIIVLQEQRRLLLNPLDEEWREVTEAKAGLIEEKALFDQDKSNLESDKKIVINNLKAAGIAVKRSNAKERQSEKLLIEAQSIKEDTENEKKMIVIEHQIQNKEYGIRISDVELLKKIYQNGIVVNEMDKKRNQEKEQEIIIREKDLARRVRNLQRATEYKNGNID